VPAGLTRLFQAPETLDWNLFSTRQNQLKDREVRSASPQRPAPAARQRSNHQSAAGTLASQQPQLPAAIAALLQLQSHSQMPSLVSTV